MGADLSPVSFFFSSSTLTFTSSVSPKSTMISVRALSVIVLALTALLSFSLLVTPADATAVSYRVAAHEKACFYTWADVPRKKLAFYFAVSPPIPLPTFN